MATTIAAAPPVRHSRPWYTILYVQVLIAIAIGIAVGYYYPDLGKQLKPLGDGFIALIKMMIAPVIFCTVVHGIASMSDLKKIGRIGLKTLVYFEVVSTVAPASTSSRRRLLRRMWRALRLAPRKTVSSAICWPSFRKIPISARSPAAI